MTALKVIPTNIVERDEEAVRVPVDRSIEAWSWILANHGARSATPDQIVSLTGNLHRAVVDGRKHLIFMLADTSLTDNQKMVFKLIFAG